MCGLAAITVSKSWGKVNSDISTPEPVPAHRRTVLGAQIQCQPLKPGAQTRCAEGTSAGALSLRTPSRPDQGEPAPSPAKQGTALFADRVPRGQLAASGLFGLPAMKHVLSITRRTPQPSQSWSLLPAPAVCRGRGHGHGRGCGCGRGVRAGSRQSSSEHCPWQGHN